MNEFKYDVVIIMVDRADDESDAEIWKNCNRNQLII